MAELQDMAAWPPVAEIDRFYEAAFRLEQLVHELRHWAAEGLRQGNAEKALSVVLGEAPRTFTGSVRDLAPILAEARESYRTLRGRNFERLLSSLATRNHGIDLLVDGKAFDSHLQATVSRAKPFVTGVDDFLGALRAYEPPAEDPGRAFDGDDAFMGQRLRGVPLRDWLRFYATQVTRISPTPGQSTELGLCQSRLRKEEAAARAAAAAEDLAAGPSRFLRAATDAEHWILRLWRAFFELRGVVKTAPEAAVTETHPGMFEEFARKFRDVFADRPSAIERFLTTLAGLRPPEPGPRGNWESLCRYLLVLAGLFEQRIAHGLRHRGRFEGDPNHFITFEGGTDGPTPEEVRAIQNDDLRRLILDIEALCADATWPVPPSFGAQLNAELKYALACARGISVDRPEVCGILAPISQTKPPPGPIDLSARIDPSANDSRSGASTTTSAPPAALPVSNTEEGMRSGLPQTEPPSDKDLDLRAMALFADGDSLSKIARKLGIGRHTFYRDKWKGGGLDIDRWPYLSAAIKTRAAVRAERGDRSPRHSGDARTGREIAAVTPDRCPQCRRFREPDEVYCFCGRPWPLRR